MTQRPGDAKRRETTIFDRYVALSIIVVLALLFGALGAVALNLDRSVDERNPPASTRIYLSLAFNPYSGLDEYFPANFTIPAGADVEFVLTNYDNATNAVPDTLAVTKGVSNAIGAATTGSTVSHTFTIDSLGINVPIPAAKGEIPAVVTFTVHVDAPGAYAWMCMAPCDAVSMATPGFMQGTMTVA